MPAEKKPTFEEAMTRLEGIVARLEKGDAPLGEAMTLFEEGTALLKQCSAALDQAEQKVDLLLANDEEVPFKGEETDGL